MASVVVTAAGDQNKNGEAYLIRKEYGMEKKDEVEMVFWLIKAASGGKNLSQRKLVEEAGVEKCLLER